MRLPELQHQCLLPWSVTVLSDRCVPRQRLRYAYLSRSCGTVAVLPVVMHHPSCREEAPPRWCQALGVLLGQPSFGLGNEFDKMSKGRTAQSAGNAAVYDGPRRPFPANQLYLCAFIHHCCGDPPATSALCNFRADDALGSVLVAPITAVRFVELNNVISNRYCLVDENGALFPPPCDLHSWIVLVGSLLLAMMMRERRALSPCRNL